MKVKTNCQICEKEIWAYIRWGIKRKFCSQECYVKVKVKNLGTRMKGRRHSTETIQKIKKIWSKKIHPLWKGDGVSYITLHQWVQRRKGKPSKCEHCGYDKSDRDYEWANVSGKYERDLKDFIRLCIPCHKKFDVIQRREGRLISRRVVRMN